MPFANNTELPPAVRAKLTPQKQRQFRAEFNSVFADTGGDERRAFSAAFSAVAINKSDLDDEARYKLKEANVTWTSQFDVVRKDDDAQLVFGWLSVAIDKSGGVVVDSQDDIIEEHVLEEAAYNFALDARRAGDMHKRIDGIGRLVESMIFTIEKQNALGIPEGTLPVGWWVGFKIDDSKTWAKIKSGEYSAFSIGGKAIREEVS